MNTDEPHPIDLVSNDTITDVDKNFEPLRFRRFDVFLLVLFIIAVCTCSAAAIGSYYISLAQRQELRNERIKILGATQRQVQAGLYAFAQRITAVSSLLKIVDRTIDLDEFDSYVKLLPEDSMSLTGYSVIINRDPQSIYNFEQSIRRLGGSYQNYTVVKNETVSYSKYSIPIVLIAPHTNNKYLGNELLDGLNEYVINEGIESGQVTYYSTLIYDRGLEQGGWSSIVVMIPTASPYDRGLVFGGATFRSLIYDSLTDIIDLSKVTFTVSDVTNQAKLLYNSVEVNKDRDPHKAYREFDSIYEFKVDYNVSFLQDTKWNIKFYTNSRDVDTFFTYHNDNIGIIASSASFIVIMSLIIGLLLIHRLILLYQARGVAKAKIAQIEQTNSTLYMLNKRSARQERNTQIVLDALDQILLVVNATGLILRTNKMFDRVFQIPNEEIQKGISVGTMLPELAFQFYKDDSLSNVHLQTTTVTGKNKIQVRCTVIATSLTGVKPRRDPGMVSAEKVKSVQEEGFLVVIKINPELI
ncbi:atpH [Acrasis kona]|uniref:AtpH n=1 Tax=Acrasis kona TaxID=1008807 RepID=A0AAW2Z5P7_9EUKA